MDYGAKQKKQRKDAILCVIILIAVACAYGAYRFATKPAVQWATTEYKIPDFRNADAIYLGRQYDLPVQEELNELIQQTVETRFAKNKVRSPGDFIFANTFEETFEKELQITVEKRDRSGKVADSWQIKLMESDDMPGKVTAFAESIVNQP